MGFNSGREGENNAVLVAVRRSPPGVDDGDLQPGDQKTGMPTIITAHADGYAATYVMLFEAGAANRVGDVFVLVARDAARHA